MSFILKVDEELEDCDPHPTVSKDIKTNVINFCKDYSPLNIFAL